MIKVCIDPGHGGVDSGARWGDILEKDLNLDISLKLSYLLREMGIEVSLTRDRDISLSLEERLRLTNSREFDVVISIHNNSAQSIDANGSEIIYPYRNRTMELLSHQILDKLVELGLTRRRVYYRLNERGENFYSIIRGTAPPTIIIECAFISNERDRNLLTKEQFREDISIKIAEGIIEFYGIEKPNKIHWAQPSFDYVKQIGLVLQEHDLDEVVTWGEFVTVIERILKNKRDIQTDYLTQEGQRHWAQKSFDYLKERGLVLQDHDLDEGVTWGEFATVIERLYRYLEG